MDNKSKADASEALKTISKLGLLGNFAILRKAPSRTKAKDDGSYNRPAGNLASEKTKMNNLDTVKENKSKTFETIRKDLIQQWKDLEERELLFRENFIKFNVFINSNQEKRIRMVTAIAKCEEEKTINSKKCQNVKREIEHLRCVLEDMNKKIEEYKCFENFLDKLINEGHFDSRLDIVKKYESLMYAKEKVSEKNTKFLKELETNLLAYSELNKNAHQEILSLRKSLSLYRRKFEETLMTSRLNYSPIADIIVCCNDLMNRHHVLSSNIKQMSKYISRGKRGGASEILKMNVCEQLQTLKLYLQFLHMISNMSRKNLRRRTTKAKIKAASAAETRRREFPNGFNSVAEAGIRQTGSSQRLKTSRARTLFLPHLVKQRSFSSSVAESHVTDGSVKYIKLPPIDGARSGRKKSRKSSRKTTSEKLPLILQPSELFLSNDDDSFMDMVDFESTRDYVDKVFRAVSRMKERAEVLSNRMHVERRFRRFEKRMSDLGKWSF